MIDIKKVNLREGNILVQPYDFNKENESKTAGFVMPQTDKFSNRNYGLVVSMAEDVLKDTEMDIYYGDVIVFDADDAIDVSMSSEDIFSIVQNYSILGVIKMDK